MLYIIRIYSIFFKAVNAIIILTVCSRLALDSVDDGILCACINILEKVLQHDCFTPNQKEKVQQWRSRLGNPRPTPKYETDIHIYMYICIYIVINVFFAYY